MPVYEYLCEACNTIFSFLVRCASGEVDPSCPRCGGPLGRVMSRFSVGSGSTSPGGEPDDSMLDGLDTEDPREMARVIRHMADDMGEDLGPEVMEALGRLEAGEDPEEVERELEESGFDLDEGAGGPAPAPSRDPGLYEA